MTSAQNMGRGRKSINRVNGEDHSQNSTGSHTNLDNVRVSIGNPFMTADLNKYVQQSSTAPISKESRSNGKNA